MALLLFFITDLEFNCIHVNGVAPVVDEIVVAVKPIYMPWRCSKRAGWAGGSSSLPNVHHQHLICWDGLIYTKKEGCVKKIEQSKECSNTLYIDDARIDDQSSMLASSFLSKSTKEIDDPTVSRPDF